jgi:uncharacterized protein
MRIIITGGTGLIGRSLSQALVADGHDVTVLTRDPTKVKDVPAGVKLQQWDGQTAQGWGQLVDGAGAIINLAGAGIADGRWSASRKQMIRQSRQNAGKAVVAAVTAAADKPKVVIQSSAVGYYGTETGDALVTEMAAPGNDFLSKVCFDWEISTAAVSRLGVRRPVIRTGIVLSNDGGAFPKLIMPFKFFVGGALGDGKQWLPWIHIDDEIRAIQFLLTNDEADGPFNLAAPAPVTNAEMGKLVGETLGRPAVVPTPSIAMRTVFGEMATLLLDGQRAVPTKLQALGFGFKFETAQAALRDLLGTKATPPEATKQPEKVSA